MPDLGANFTTENPFKGFIQLSSESEFHRHLRPAVVIAMRQIVRQHKLWVTENREWRAAPSLVVDMLDTELRRLGRVGKHAKLPVYTDMPVIKARKWVLVQARHIQNELKTEHSPASAGTTGLRRGGQTLKDRYKAALASKDMPFELKNLSSFMQLVQAEARERLRLKPNEDISATWYEANKNYQTAFKLVQSHMAEIVAHPERAKKGINWNTYQAELEAESRTTEFLVKSTKTKETEKLCALLEDRLIRACSKDDPEALTLFQNQMRSLLESKNLQGTEDARKATIRGVITRLIDRAAAERRRRTLLKEVPHESRRTSMALAQVVREAGKAWKNSRNNAVLPQDWSEFLPRGISEQLRTKALNELSILATSEKCVGDAWETYVSEHRRDDVVHQAVATWMEREGQIEQLPEAWETYIPQGVPDDRYQQVLQCLQSLTASEQRKGEKFKDYVKRRLRDVEARLDVNDLAETPYVRGKLEHALFAHQQAFYRDISREVEKAKFLWYQRKLKQDKCSLQDCLPPDLSALYHQEITQILSHLDEDKVFEQFQTEEARLLKEKEVAAHREAERQANEKAKFERWNRGEPEPMPRCDWTYDPGIASPRDIKKVFDNPCAHAEIKDEYLRYVKVATATSVLVPTEDPFAPYVEKGKRMSEERRGVKGSPQTSSPSGRVFPRRDLKEHSRVLMGLSAWEWYKGTPKLAEIERDSKE
ncbi:MAG: hypothetical protein WAZ18_06415 [Alphaproteobacteria bacterium]